MPVLLRGDGVEPPFPESESGGLPVGRPASIVAVGEGTGEHADEVLTKTGHGQNVVLAGILHAVPAPPWLPREVSFLLALERE